VFLQALADHRTALGLPALTVDWGAITGVGYVSRNPDLVVRLARQGLQGISPAAALSALGGLLRRSASRAIVSRGPWGRSAPRTVMNGGGAAADLPGVPVSAVRAELTPAVGEVSPDAVRRSLANTTARVLETSPDRLDPDRTLSSLGFDSLMAVELQTAIRSQHGVDVSIAELLERLSLRSLCDSVLDRLGGGG
jgi:acyl carrier protein